MDLVGMQLAVLAPFDFIYVVSFHGRPVVPSSDDYFGHKLGVDVAPVNSFMCLLKDFDYF